MDKREKIALRFEIARREGEVRRFADGSADADEVLALFTGPPLLSDEEIKEVLYGGSLKANMTLVIPLSARAVAEAQRGKDIKHYGT